MDTKLIWAASRVFDHWWRLRKVELFCCYEDGEILYSNRYFTSFFPRLKRRLAERRVARLQLMGKNA